MLASCVCWSEGVQFGNLHLVNWKLIIKTNWSGVTHWHETYTLKLMWLIDYLLFYVPLKNISLIWRRHHYQWRAAKFWPLLGSQGIWAGSGLYRATPAATRGLGFSGLIRRTAPFSRLLRHTSIILYCIKLGLKRFIEISILFNIICSIQCSILCLNFRFDKSLLNVMQNKSDVIDLHVMFYLQNGQKNIHTCILLLLALSEMKTIVNV